MANSRIPANHSIVYVRADESGMRYRAVCAGCAWSSPWWPPALPVWADHPIVRDARTRAVAAAAAHIRSATRRRPLSDPDGTVSAREPVGPTGPGPGPVAAVHDELRPARRRRTKARTA